MNRHERGRRAAIKAARLSKFYAHRVGAVLFIGSRCIAIGCNKHKTHPFTGCYSQHAEFNVSRKIDSEQAKSATLYVARLTRTDRVSYSKPCNDCQSVIQSLGIAKVYYTGYDGQLKQMKDLSRLAG